MGNKVLLVKTQFRLFANFRAALVTVIGLMGIVFFADYIMPDKREKRIVGKFPWLSLIPFLITPIVFISFYFFQQTFFNYLLLLHQHHQFL